MYNIYLLLNIIVIALTIYVVYFTAYKMMKYEKDSEDKYVPQDFYFYAGFHALLVLVVTPFFIKWVIDVIYCIYLICS